MPSDPRAFPQRLLYSMIVRSGSRILKIWRLYVSAFSWICSAVRGFRVSEEEDHVVPQGLELAQLVDDHGVPEVQVRRRGVKPQLHPQRGASTERPAELLRQLLLHQQVHTPDLQAG